MSITLMSRVWDSALGASRKLVALAYANNADDTEGRAWASVAYLERRTSLDRKTIIAAVSALEAAGYLTDTGERKGQTGQIRVYRVRVPESELLEESQSFRERVPKTDGKGPVFPAKESQKRDTESPLNHPESSGSGKPRAKRAGHGRENGIDYDWTAFEFTGLDETDRLAWQDMYPAISVPDQVARAAEWLRSNPTKRKSNYRRFLNTWLSKAQDRGH